MLFGVQVLKSSSRSHSLFAHTNTTDRIPVHTAMRSGRNLSDWSLSTFKIGAVVRRQVRAVVEIATKSSFLCVAEQKPYPVFFFLSPYELSGIVSIQPSNSQAWVFQLDNRAFSHDVTAAISVSQNNETAAILV